MMQTLTDLLARNAFGSGAVAAVLRGGRLAASAARGTTADSLPDPVTEATLFDLASLTKPFLAATLLRLVEEGILQLDEPVATWLSTFRAPGRDRVTLRRLLTHTSGLPAILPTGHDPLTTPLVRAEGFEYSCVGFIVAGLLAEHATGAALADLMRDRILGPLGLSETGFRPDPTLRHRIAATEYQAGRGLVHGVVHDETSRSLGGVAGNAGLFGTAGELARFGEMLRLGGTLDGVTVLQPLSVAEMTRDQLPPHLDPGYRHGLGLRLNDSAFMGRLASGAAVARAGSGSPPEDAGAGAFGHTGFTGTSLVVDPGRELVVVLLTNRVHPSREWIDLMPLRRAVAEWAAASA
jgi:CubicO group peptidase (beta-lactamase class C family)